MPAPVVSSTCTVRDLPAGGVSSLDPQHDGVHGGSGSECASRERTGDGDAECRTPAPGGRRLRGHPAGGDLLRHDEVGAHEAAARPEEPPDERRRHGEGRVGDDSKRLPGEPQVAGVSQHDDDALVREALPQLACATIVQFDGDHPSAGSQQWSRQGARAGADVEHEFVRGDRCLLDEASRPTAIESVVPPPRWFPPGHGGP